MTPEELEEIRSTLEFASQAGAKDEFMDTTFNLLEFIDEQAAQIEALKEKLQSAPKSGLYGKYIIQKADGSPVDPKADYFILRLNTDPIARRAALQYSYYLAIGKEDTQLAKDLQARVARYDPKATDAVYLRYVGVLKNEVVEMLEAKNKQIKELQDIIDKPPEDADWVADYHLSTYQNASGNA